MSATVLHMSMSLDGFIAGFNCEVADEVMATVTHMHYRVKR